MNRLTTGLAALVLAAATMACGGSPTGGSTFVSGNDRTGAGLSPGELTFTSTQSFSNPAAPTATGGVGGIDFAGSLTTGTPCNTITAVHSISGNNITVTITATGNAEVCVQVVTHNNYTGRISAIPPGTYDLIVRHTERGTTTTASTATVTVQ